MSISYTTDFQEMHLFNGAISFRLPKRSHNPSLVPVFLMLVEEKLFSIPVHRTYCIPIKKFIHTRSIAYQRIHNGFQ